MCTVPIARQSFSSSHTLTKSKWLLVILWIQSLLSSQANALYSSTLELWRSRSLGIRSTRVKNFNHKWLSPRTANSKQCPRYKHGLLRRSRWLARMQSTWNKVESWSVSLTTALSKYSSSCLKWLELWQWLIIQIKRWMINLIWIKFSVKSCLDIKQIYHNQPLYAFYNAM